MKTNATAPALYITSAKYNQIDRDHEHGDGVISRSGTLYVNFAVETDADRGEYASASLSLYAWIDYDLATGQPTKAQPARGRDVEFSIVASMADLTILTSALAAHFPEADRHDWTPTPLDLTPLRELHTTDSCYYLTPSMDAEKTAAVDSALDQFDAFNLYAARVEELREMAEKFPAPVALTADETPAL